MKPMQMRLKTIGAAPPKSLADGTPKTRDLVFANVECVQQTEHGPISLDLSLVFVFQEEGKVRVNYQYMSPWGSHFPDGDEEEDHTIDIGPLIKRIGRDLVPLARHVRGFGGS